MGNLFSGGGSSGGATKKPLIAGGFPDDGAREFPSATSDTVTKRLQQQLQARSGRSSTDLTGSAGTRPYFAQFLGNTS